MDCFEKIGRIISKFTVSVKDMSKTAKLNRMVSDEEKKINDAYIQIGKVYYETYKYRESENSGQLFTKPIEDINDSKARIKSYTEQVKQIEGVMEQEGEDGMIQTVPHYSNSTEMVAHHKKIGKIACVVAILTLLITVIGTIVSLSVGNNPEKILKRYLDAYLSGDYDTIAKYSAYNADNLINEMCKSEGMTVEEFEEKIYKEAGVRSISKYFNKMINEQMSEIRSEAYGQNFEMTIDIIDTTELKQSEMNDIIGDLKESLEYEGYNESKIIKLNKITQMVKCEYQFTIKGGGEEDMANDEMVMVKIGGKWRVLDKDFIGSIFYML